MPIPAAPIFSFKALWLASPSSLFFSLCYILGEQHPSSCVTQSPSSALSPEWEPHSFKSPAGDSSLPALVCLTAAPPNPIPTPCHPVSPCLSLASMPFRLITVGQCFESPVKPSLWLPHPSPNLLPSAPASLFPSPGLVPPLPRIGSRHRAIDEMGWSAAGMIELQVPGPLSFVLPSDPA